MAFDISTKKHGVSFPSRIAASAGSPHIFDLHLAKDRDNGTLAMRGDYIHLGTYEEDTNTAIEFNGIIREQATNGNWYIEVVSSNALYVHQPVVSPYGEKKFQAESLYYNEAGLTVKAYELIKGDMFEVSAELIDGTPARDAKVTFENGKYKVAAGE